MNKLSKSLIVLFLAFFIGSYFSIDFVQANNELVLEITEECDIQYTGDSCVAEMKLFNNSDEIFDGTAFLHIDYQGVCGNGFFDGQGIVAQFSIADDNWLDFSGWNNGTTIVSGFEIAKGETQPKLKIETIPSLCPGNYIFIFTINGTAETGEEYATTPITLGSGGGGLPLGLTIQYENSRVATTTATITWLTSYRSTSRVIYRTETGPGFHLAAGEPNYGYEFWTGEFDNLIPINSSEDGHGVTGHSITIENLVSGTTYYFRCVSHASPEIIGTEHSFTTLAMGDTGAEGDAGDGSGDGDRAGDGDTGDGVGTGDGDTGGAGDTGDTGGDTSGTGGTGDTGDAGDAGSGDDTGNTGGEDDDFEYGDNIWEHKGDDDLLSTIDDELGEKDGDDSKFLASIATFFGDLEGWRLILVFLFWIILLLIIIRLIKAWIDRKKNKQS